MTLNNHTDPNALVVGASRGLGRGIAIALANSGVPVTAVARSGSALDELVRDAGSVRSEVADATGSERRGIGKQRLGQERFRHRCAEPVRDFLDLGARIERTLSGEDGDTPAGALG